MNAPQNNDEAQALVDRITAELGEHFESVRIFASYKSEQGTGNTIGFNSGVGNLYAQLGQVREWLLKQDEFVRADARENWKADQEEETEDGG